MILLSSGIEVIKNYTKLEQILPQIRGQEDK